MTTASGFATAGRNRFLSSALSQGISVRRLTIMRSILLWLVGVPIPIIILLWFFMR